MAAYQFKQAQRVSDGDFFTMSEVDADLREAEDHLKQDKSHKSLVVLAHVLGAK